MSLAEIIEKNRQEREAPYQQSLLFFDIEVAPMLSFHWQPKAEYIGPHLVEADSWMISWAAKWANQKRCKSDVLTSDEALDQNDGRIVESLADLMRQADVLVGHNLNRFDVPKVNNRLLELRLEPLVPPRTIDTLTVAKRSFKLPYNRLDEIADKVGVEGKIGTNFDLWRGCYYGDEKSLQKMVRYNRRDVTVLQDVYEAMLPYARGLPRLVDAAYADQVACPTCGSVDFEDAPPHRTNASTFPAYRCVECGRYCRARSADKRAKLALHPL